MFSTTSGLYNQSDHLHTPFRHTDLLAAWGPLTLFLQIQVQNLFLLVVSQEASVRVFPLRQ